MNPWIRWGNQIVNSLNKLSAKVAKMANELEDLTAAVAAIKSEFSTDVQTLLDKQAVLNTTVADLKAQIAALPAATGIDPAAVEAAAQDLNATTKAMHEKLNPPAAPPA